MDLSWVTQHYCLPDCLSGEIKKVSAASCEHVLAGIQYSYVITKV